MHRCRTEAAQGGVNLLCRNRSGGKIEGFAQTDPDRGGDLHDDLFFGIVHRFEVVGDLILFIDGTDGTVNHALSAADTGAVLQLKHRCRGHHRHIAATDELEGEHSLKILTHLDAAAALDALLRLQHDRSAGGVFRPFAQPHFVRLIADAEFSGQILKLALAVSDARQTGGGVV